MFLNLTIFNQTDSYYVSLIEYIDWEAYLQIDKHRFFFF